VLSLVGLGLGRSRPAGQREALVIQREMAVTIEYLLTVDGLVVDSTLGKPPLRYVHGRGEIIPGLERKLEGLRAGEQRAFTVMPEEGYGIVDPTAIRELSADELPPEITPIEGLVVSGSRPDGQPFHGTIRAVNEDETVTLDLNHPLAGKTLHFTVTIVSIAPVGDRYSVPMTSQAVP